MLQHRHVWNDGTFSAWHAPERKHTGERNGVAYEDDTVFETREFTPGTRKGRAAKDPLYAAPPEYGPSKEEQLYATPPEYATPVAAEAVKEAEAVVATASKNGNLPRALKA